MPTINGEVLAPRQGVGLATVLRPDYTPLRTLQQGDATRARRAQADAALKQKQAADIAKQWAEDRKLGLDTGGLFQEPFNAYTANAQEVIGKNYADEQAGRITTAERIQANANYRNEVERERLLGIDKDKAAAAYVDGQRVKPFRDMQGLDTALGESVLGPDGQRVRASAYDERAMINKWDADPRTYAADPIISDYYQRLQASTVDDASAGRIGGLHTSSSLTYKGLIPTRRADGTYDVKRDAVGRPVLAITGDELATARASNHNLNMAVGRLRYEYDNQRKADTTLPEKSDLDLFQEASQKYVSFRQADSAGRNAQPRAAGGGAAGYTVNAPTSYDGGVSGADVAAPDVTTINPLFPNAAPDGSGYPGARLPGPGFGTTASQSVSGFYSPARRPQPTYSTKTNPVKQFEFKGLPANEILQPGKNGNLEHVKNNNQAIYGVAQEGVTLLRNTKTGELRPGASTQQSFENELRKLGPDWKTEPGVQVAVPKNKNYAADSEQVMARLQAREAAKKQAQYNYVPKTTDQLEKEAFDLASGGTVQTYLPYNGTTRGSIDAQTKGAYREYADKILPAAEQRIRGSKPAAPHTRPSFLPAKKTATQPTTRNTSSTAGKTGGML